MEIQNMILKAKNLEKPMNNILRESELSANQKKLDVEEKDQVELVTLK